MKKNNDPVYLETTKSELIKLLEFVCKNKGKKVFPSQIKNELFPNLDIEEIYTLIYSIKYRHIQPISLTISNGDPRTSHIQYRIGLEEYVWNLKEKEKQIKLHRIVEFLSTQSTNSKQSFDTEEIAKAFSPELTNYEVIRLCETLIANGDVINAPTDQSDSRDVLNVVVSPRTRTVYQNKKYLEEQSGYRISPNIVSHDNISIIGGSNYGNINQENQTVKVETKKEKGLPSWANWLIVIFTVLGAMAAIIGAIFLFK